MALDRVSALGLISVVWLGLAARVPAQPPQNHYHCYETSTGTGIMEGKTEFQEIVEHHCMELYELSAGLIQKFRRQCQRNEDARWGAGPCPSSGQVGVCCQLGAGMQVGMSWHAYRGWVQETGQIACRGMIGTWIPAASIPSGMRGPGDPFLCQPCDPAVVEIEVESPYRHGCYLDAKGRAEIDLSAVVTSIPPESGLDENDVEWAITAGEGVLSQATGSSTTYTQTSDYAGPITVTATFPAICESGATVTFEATPIVVNVLSADGKDKAMMGFFEGRETTLEAQLEKRPADYDSDLIKWELTSGQAGKLAGQLGETNTLEQRKVLSSGVYDTRIRAHYGKNEPGEAFRTSNHMLRVISVLLPNGHRIKSDDGEKLYVSGWVEDRSPREAEPAAFTRRNPPTSEANQKAKLELKFEIQPAAAGGGAPILIRSSGMSGALALDPAPAQVVGGEVLLQPTEAKEAFPGRVLYSSSEAVELEALFDGGQTWVRAGSAAFPIYVINDDPNDTTVYETPLHIGTTRLEAAGTPADYLVAMQAIFAELKFLRVIRVNDPSPLEYWGPKILGSSVGSGGLTRPAYWTHTAEGLLEKGAGTCAAWSRLLAMTFRIQGFDQFVIRDIKIRDDSSWYEPRAFLVKSWGPLGAWETPVSGTGIPAQGNPNPRDFEKTFPRHVIVRTQKGSKTVIFDPSYGTETIVSKGGQSGWQEALFRYENATIDWYVYSWGGVWDQYYPNDATKCELEYAN